MVLYKDKAMKIVWDLAQRMQGQSFESNRELLNDALIGYRYVPEKEDKEDDTLYDWSDKFAKKFIKKCSDNQISFFQCIKDNGNKATMEDLINHLGVTDSSSIAGVVTGLTRKCQTQDIPNVWCKSKNAMGEDVYCISQKSYPFIINHI